jgi:hypothetical protein
MSWRDDPIDEPWYELDFRMSRWSCPSELPSPLMDDVIEAIREMDRILLDAMKMVDRFSYGVESSQTRYTRESVYEVFRGEFERAEDQFSVARAALAARWSILLTKHSKLIVGLPEHLRNRLTHPEQAYAVSYSVKEVHLDENQRQFLEGIQPGKEKMVLSAE